MITFKEYLKEHRWGGIDEYSRAIEGTVSAVKFRGAIHHIKGL